MAKFITFRGRLSNTIRVKILDSTSTVGAGKTGLTSASAGLIISTIANNEAAPTVYTSAGSTTETIATLGTFAAPTATKCRFKEVDATNHPGLYEIQLADARMAVVSARSLIVSIQVTGGVPVDAEIQLEDWQEQARLFYGCKGTPYFVSLTGSDSNSGLSWATAKLTPKTVIEAATAGDVVVVGVGTYALGNNYIAIPASVRVYLADGAIFTSTYAGPQPTIALSTNSVFEGGKVSVT
jgi:hypothetical protein